MPSIFYDDRIFLQAKRIADSLDGIEAAQKESKVFLERSAVAQESIAATLKRVAKAFLIPNPGAISAKVTSEENGVMKFKVMIPAFPDPIGDVVKGELTVTADGSTNVMDVAIGQTEVTDLTAAEGTVAELSYVLVDDAGNKSPVPSVFNLPVADTIAPPSPGPLNAEVTGE